jgi:hypothetical protein
MDSCSAMLEQCRVFFKSLKGNLYLTFVRRVYLMLLLRHHVER